MAHSPPRISAVRLPSALHAVHVHAGRADHPVLVNQRVVAAALGSVPAEGKWVSAAQRDVRGGVLVEEGVVKQPPGLRDGRAGRHQGHFPDAARALVGVEQLQKGGLAPAGAGLHHLAALEAHPDALHDFAAHQQRLAGHRHPVHPLPVRRGEHLVGGHVRHDAHARSGLVFHPGPPWPSARPTVKSVSPWGSGKCSAANCWVLRKSRTRPSRTIWACQAATGSGASARVTLKMSRHKADTAASGASSGYTFAAQPGTLTAPMHQAASKPIIFWLTGFMACARNLALMASRSASAPAITPGSCRRASETSSRP